MKRLLLAVLLLLFALTTNFASEEPVKKQLLFSVTSQSVARVGVINRTDNSLQLFFLDSSGKILITETVEESSNYFKTYDLHDLPDGNYKIRLGDGKNKLEKSFTKKRDLVTIN